MPSAERFQWLRRDGAPLAVSLVLHLLLLLLIAPWLVMRTIPAQQVLVEVMLEPYKAIKEQKHPEKAARVMKRLRPILRAPQPVKIKTLQVQIETQQSAAKGGGKRGGKRGRSTPAEGVSAGLSLPKAGASNSSADPGMQAAGVTALGRNATAPSPLAPSAGTAPQPSAAASQASPRPGEDRQDGTVNLAGSAPQSQALNPEFRQAARLGGMETLRGGSRPPEEGLARQSGSLNNTALLASAAVPQAVIGMGGTGGGQSAAMAAPAANAGGRTSVAAGEGAAVIGKATGAAPGQGTPPVGGGSSQSGSGLSTAGRSTGGADSATPGERGAGLIAAGTGSAGPVRDGTGRDGTGRGEGSRGEGRGIAPPGAGSEGRDVSGLQAMAESGAGVAGRDGGTSAELSGSTGTRASTQALSEAQQTAMQAQQAQGNARVIEERFTATALKVDSPRHVCDLPLMLAGFDRRPIPPGLDSINASAASAIAGETPPRHDPSNLQPRYPLQALATRAEGRAVVRAEVRTDGRIGRAWVKQTSGAAVLDQSALATVQSWRFFPAQRNGMAVTMWLDVPIEYKTP